MNKGAKVLRQPGLGPVIVPVLAVSGIVTAPPWMAVGPGGWLAHCRCQGRMGAGVPMHVTDHDREWQMVVIWKRVVLSGALLLVGLVSGCSVLAPTPITYLSQDPAPGILPYGKVAYVDDGKCPTGQVNRLIGGDAKKSIPRLVECVARPQPQADEWWNSPASGQGEITP